MCSWCGCGKPEDDHGVWRTDRRTGHAYPMRISSGREAPKRCPKCGKVASYVDLQMYGQCWYCWIDTSADETAQYIRNKGLYMRDPKKVAEFTKRRMAREQRGTA